jgi:nucleoside-diphosphate-sugar epimerase
MQLKGKKVFITGGAGFIGSRIIEQIVDDCEVVVYDNLRRDALSKTTFANHKNIHMIEGDVLDTGAIEPALKGCSIVIHAAGIAGVDTVIEKPTQTMTVNLSGTANVLRAAKESGSCERFINFSTSEVFGSYAFRARETDWTSAGAVGEARWTYAVSKLAAEHLCYAYFHEFKLPTVTVRPFNVYGPGQVGEGAIHHFVLRAIQGEPLEIHGDGDQIRSWVHVSDMVQGVLECITNDKASGQSYNIGNPRGTVTIRSLAELVVQLAESQSKIVHVPKNYVDVELRIPNVDKAKEDLGFQPKVDLKDGLLDTIDWYQRFGDGG